MPKDFYSRGFTIPSPPSAPSTIACICNYPGHDLMTSVPQAITNTLAPRKHMSCAVFDGHLTIHGASKPYNARSIKLFCSLFFGHVFRIVSAMFQPS